MSKWNLIVDVALCHNCNNCALAVADEFDGNDHPGYAAPMPHHGHRWIDILRKERGQAPMVDVAYVPVMCQHCDAAPCMQADTVGAISKRADGIVLIDPVKGKGQKHLVDACPYGAIWWNDERELPQHWFFDAHLLDRGWKAPRCEQVCPTGALLAVKTGDAAMKKMAADQGLTPLRPDLATAPRVHYKNLGAYTQAFIGGSLQGVRGGVPDCLAGAGIVLKRDGGEVARTTSDAFGDFKLDGLDEDSGAYSLDITHPGWAPKTLAASLGKSLYLGVITLDPGGS